MQEKQAHRVTDAQELGEVACYDCATRAPMNGRQLPKGWTAHALDGTAHCPACSESLDDYDVEAEDGGENRRVPPKTFDPDRSENETGDQYGLSGDPEDWGSGF